MTARTDDQAAPDFLSGGGAMGALMRAKDWRTTPLGAPETWPQSLRTSVSTCLNCAFPILVWWGPELLKLYNDAYALILGNKHPAALGTPGRQVWPEIWDVIGPMLGRVLVRGEPTRAEDLLLMLHRHGYAEECYFSFSYSPIRDESGVGGVFCPVIETTERVIGERRLRLLRRLAERTTDLHSPDQVCGTAASCLTEEAAHDLPFAAFYLADEEGRTAHLAGAAGFVPGSPTFPGTVRLDGTDGSPWPFTEAAASGEAAVITALGARCPNLPAGPWDAAPETALLLPLGRSGARPLGFMLAGLNPHRPAEEVKGFADLVARQVMTVIANARAYEEERKRAEALAEIDRAKTAFFSNVSHEFRTPLTLMLGPLEDARGDNAATALAPAQRAWLDVVHRNALRLLKLVNTLLDFSRIEAGRAQASYQPTDLAGLTIDLASGFRSATDRAGLFLEIDCPSLPQPVFVDRPMWEKIVLNLLSNAFKFTFEGGIAVTLRAADNEARLTVRDTGVGIPADELSRLFERFHRIEGQRSRSFEGSGIGLALVHELVRLHGGTIEARSEPGAGTTFVVDIPFGTAHLPADRIGAAQPLSPTTTQAGFFAQEALRWLPDTDAGDAFPLAPASSETITERRQAVLVADDNADMRGYVRRLLGERYRVTTVADGYAALDAIRRDRPDLVLSDVMMPNLDGFGLLRAIRADPALRDLPVVLVSARAGEEARSEGLDAGADDYLTKPFSARDLLARVSATLAAVAARRETMQAALDSAESLRRMFEQAPGFMCMLRGPDHVFELANAAYLRLIGNRDVLGKSVRDVFPELAGQGFFEKLDDVHRTGQVFAGHGQRVLLRYTPGGPLEERFLDFVYQPIKDRNGAVTGIFVEGADVTDRLRAENALRDANERLELRVTERTAELHEALTQLHQEVQEREKMEEALRQAQKMEAIGQLTGGIAHDFNNLLTGIGGSLELAQSRLAQGRAEQVGRFIDGAMMSVDRAAALTHRLLAFARRQTLDPKTTDANRLVTNLEELIRRTVGPAIQVETVLAAELWPTLCDANQLESALLNLCINARDAMPEGGRLTIETANVTLDRTYAATQPDVLPGDYVSLSVTDTGTGMSPEIAARVFEPFFTTKPLGQGTGLGLSMLYGFIRQSDGHVRIDSVERQGTTVRLYLPRDESGATGAAAGGREKAGTTRAEAGETVLVVEDESVVRSLITEVLAELGYAALEAADGPSGLRILQSRARVDLLVTDVGLPGMNGRQLADAARERRPGLKVLFITGYAHNAVIGNGFLAPGMEMIVKPFTLDALAARIRTMIKGEGCAG